jgi:hypothetical protein
MCVTDMYMCVYMCMYIYSITHSHTHTKTHSLSRTHTYTYTYIHTYIHRQQGPKNPIRQLCFRLLRSDKFEYFITVFIVANVITMMMKTVCYVVYIYIHTYIYIYISCSLHRGKCHQNDDENSVLCCDYM